MLADDLLVLIRLWHFGEEVFDEIVGSHGSQVPFELVHQKQFHLLQKMGNKVNRRAGRLGGGLKSGDSRAPQIGKQQNAERLTSGQQHALDKKTPPPPRPGLRLKRRKGAHIDHISEWLHRRHGGEERGATEVEF